MCGKDNLNHAGPVILLSNHPNSFLDAVLIGVCRKEPFHFLVRADMFHSPFLNWILRGLNGIPVYRSSENKARLRENHDTFRNCINILKKKGTILIFAEGITIHDWEIKPVKSGPARLIWDALHEGELQDQLSIIPVGINYNQYNHAGKHVHVVAGKPVEHIQPFNSEKYGAWNTRIKTTVREALRNQAFSFSHPHVNEMTVWRSLLTNADQFQEDHCKKISTINGISHHIHLEHFNIKRLSRIWIQEYFPFNKSRLQHNKMICLIGLIPAMAGYILNYPFYKLLHVIVKWIFGRGIFFDSVFFAALTFLFPFYWWRAGIGLGLVANQPAWMISTLIIATGFICNRWWPHFASIYNYHILSKGKRKQLEMLWTNNQKPDSD